MMKTTPTAARRIAEIIIPEGIDKKGKPARIQTAYGPKTREGIADLIESELKGTTQDPLHLAAPDLLAALQNAANVLAGLAVGHLKGIDRDSPALLLARQAIAKATVTE